MEPVELAGASAEEGSRGAAPDKPAEVDRAGVSIKITVFVVGAASLGTEIAAARLVAPFFGSSTIVWANTIGVVLVALSLGYWWGGRLADRGPRRERLSRLILAGGAALALVPLVGHPFLTWTIGPLETLSAGAFFGSLLGVLVLVAGPVLLLGAVAPFAIRLSVSRVEEAGQTSGRLYAISTAGSLLGTFLAALLLIPFVGTHRTFLIFALSVTIVGALGLPRRWWIVPLVVGVLIALPPGGIKTEAANGSKVIYETETAYQYIRVLKDKEGTHLLQIDDSMAIHAIYAPGSWLSEDYWDEFLVLPITVSGRPPATVAILGNATGTTARAYGHFFPNTLVYGVDIDPKMIDIGRRFFDLHGPRVKLVSQDARPFLRKSGRFDSIFLDAYREPEIPWYLTTREFFELVRRHLVPGGSLIANVAHSVGSVAVEQTITRTIRSVFPYVVRDSLTDTNSVLVASNSPASADRLQSYLPRLPQELREVGAKTAKRLSPTLRGGSVYTDDRDAIEWLIDRDIIQHDLQGSSSSSGNSGGSGTSGGSHGVSGLCTTPCTDEEGDYVDQVALVPQSAVPSVVPIVSMRVRVKNLEKSSLEIGSSELPITDSRQHKVEPSDFARVAQCPRVKTLTLAPGQEGVFHPCYKLADRTDVPTELLLGGKGGTEIPLR